SRGLDGFGHVHVRSRGSSSWRRSGEIHVRRGFARARNLRAHRGPRQIFRAHHGHGQHRRRWAGAGSILFQSSRAERGRVTAELLPLSIGIGLAVGLVLNELFGIAAGGMIVPGYLALSLTKPADVALTVGGGLLT